MTTTIPTPPELQAYEARVQITWVEPLPPDFTPEPGLQPPPRANLVASVVPHRRGDAASAAEEFWQQTSQAVPGIERPREDDHPITFADGAEGHQLAVQFYATPDVKLRQVHLFRIDDDLLTQFVVTVDEAADPAREEELVAIAMTMKPER